MTLAIAVSPTRTAAAKSHQVGEIAAEMKKYAKSFSKSIFAVDRRK